jgi:hypothetical protein
MDAEAGKPATLTRMSGGMQRRPPALACRPATIRRVRENPDGGRSRLLVNEG